MNTYRYTANVNGTARSVVFSADPEDWGHEWIEEADGSMTEPEMNLASASLLVDNEYDTYRYFYEDATDADYDADRTEEALYRVVEGAWERVE
jgi:hypothetical protein